MVRLLLTADVDVRYKRWNSQWKVEIGSELTWYIVIAFNWGPFICFQENENNYIDWFKYRSTKYLSVVLWTNTYVIVFNWHFNYCLWNYGIVTQNVYFIFMNLQWISDRNQPFKQLICLNQKFPLINYLRTDIWYVKLILRIVTNLIKKCILMLKQKLFIYLRYLNLLSTSQPENSKQIVFAPKIKEGELTPTNMW